MADLSSSVVHKKLVRVEFIGHAFLVRLQKFIHGVEWDNLKLNKTGFDLKFSAKGMKGGMKLHELIRVCKWDTFNACADHSGGLSTISSRPDIVYIEIGNWCNSKLFC